MSERSEIMTDLQYISRILVRNRICDDISPLEKAVSIMYPGVNEVSYVIDKLNFPNVPIPRGIIPNNIAILDICFSIEIHENILDECEISYPVKLDETHKYNFSIEVSGLNENADEFYSGWHLDFDKKVDGVDNIHPFFHLTYGSMHLRSKLKNTEENGFLGKMLLLPTPRIPYPPMDVILGIDFILRNFYVNNLIEGILDDPRYKRAVKRSQVRLWKPYMLSVAHHWCGFKCNEYQSNVEEMTQGIMPYLI